MRIIQDSEDEDDLELDEVTTVAPSAVHAPPKQNMSNPPAQPRELGTGSTDSLKRHIETTHRAHFQSPANMSPDHLLRHAPHSSPTLLEHANKRRKTSGDDSSVLLSNNSSLKKTSEPIHSSPILGEQVASNADTRQTTSIAEGPWGLQGTMREAWQHHEPMGLFPEPSSTVPNATATQQRLLEEVMAPAFLGIEPEPDAPRYEPAKSSVPWSDYLKSSSRNTEDISDQLEKISDEHEISIPHVVSRDPVLEPSSGIIPTVQLSQHSRQGPSVQLNGGLSHEEIVLSNADPRELMALPTIKSQEIKDIIALPTIKSQEIRGTIALNVFSPHPHKSPDEASVVSPGGTVKQKSSPVLDSEEDLIMTSLPKEQYIPRPSRSRSLKLATEDLVDYSVRPEKAVRKTRRSRTTGDVAATPPATTPEKVQQICDMGFTPSLTQKALRRNNGDVTHTVNWLIANGVSDEDELAPPRSSKLKSKGKKNDKQNINPLQTEVVNEAASTSQKRDRRGSPITSPKVNSGALITGEMPTDASGHNIAIVVPSKSPRVKVVIPRSKGQVSSSKVDVSDGNDTASPQCNSLGAPSGNGERRKSTTDKPELHLEDPLPSTTQIPVEKKKGRGRPRKEAKSTKIIPEEEQGDPKFRAREKSVEPQITQPDASVATKSNGQETPRQPTLARESAQEPATTLHPNIAVPTPSNEPFPNSEKSSKLISGCHTTPIKGKVPHRIGLSKRARIAPLLRIMKK